MTIKYAQNGKRDLHHLEDKYDNKIEELNNQTWKHEYNRKTIIAYLLACRRGRVRSGKRFRRISKSWLYRIMGILKLLSEDWLDKSFDACEIFDWDSFYDRMEDDLIKSQHGKSYNINTKCKIYKVIKKFAKWKWGNDSSYPDFCANWVTAEQKQSKEHISFEESRTMIDLGLTVRVRCLIAVLFDGGFRIEEVANLRWCDLTYMDSGYFRAKVRAETSKTKKERFVDIYLEQTTQLIQQLKNVAFNGNECDYIFPVSYSNLYKTCVRIGLRAIGKRVNPHMLRHSSATYYADIIKTYQQFCYRYGWDLSSDSPQRYFHGSNSDLVYKTVVNHETSKFKSDYETVKVEKQQMNLQLTSQKDEMKQMKNEVRELRDMLVLVMSKLSNTQNVPDNVLVKCGEHFQNGGVIIEAK